MKYIYWFSVVVVLIAVFIGCGTDKGQNPAIDSGSGDGDNINLTITRKPAADNNDAGVGYIMITFDVPYASQWILKILGPTGYGINEFSGFDGPGTINIAWDGKNKDGEVVKSGLYIFEVEIGREIYRKKLLIQ